MRFLQNESSAFRLALLRSERLRIYILFIVVAIALIFRVVRTIIEWDPENASSLLWVALVAAIFVAVELLVLRNIGRGMESDGNMPHSIWLWNILLETAIPAFLIAFISSPTIPAPYRALANPAFCLYFVLITLSTLRLNPSISLLCGVASGVTYVCAAMYHGWRLRRIFGAVSLYSPEETVLAYAVMLVIAGLAAALVAREIRQQVEAALREAETRREVQHLQHDLDVARSIQQSLLPKAMPQISGYDIAAWNKPADQTGGDYYDWQPLPDGRVVIGLADVTGHGIGPALLAAVCRAYSRATFGQHKGFLESMERINAAVSTDVGEGRFVMFAAAIVGVANSQLELLSAGQAPLFIYWLQHDRFDKMKAQGLPLGISSEFISDPPHNLPFSPGDLLVLTTDGFFEWANPKGELFGTERLENSVRAHRERSAAEIISSLYEDVLRYSEGTGQNDDLTAVVIKRVGS